MMVIRGLLVAGALLAAAALPAMAADFEGIVTHVSDGDTLSVRPVTGGPPRPVRLEGIDAPEICQPHGEQARAALAARVLRRHVHVTSRADDDYQRAVGRVSLDGEDLGLWMVRRGHAWSYRFRSDPGPYWKAESHARQARLGLWDAGAPIPPREFRKQHGSCR